MFDKKTILKDFYDEFLEHFIVIMMLIIITALATGIIKNYKHLHEEPPKNFKVSIKFNISFPDEIVKIGKMIKKCETDKNVKAILDEHTDISKKFKHVILPVDYMKMELLGKYYITGYTSLECDGSTMTASGATVHKGNPTTCAIDPALWDFGDLFYIPYFDQVYVAEDTGSAVKGKHLDLYFYDDEYNYALSITGYYEVYSVEYITGYVQADYFNITDIVWEVQNG